MECDLHFDAPRGRLTFALPCPEAVSVCQALCCRLPWDILLTLEEAASGQYESERVCTLTRRGCAEQVPTCIHWRQRLKRREDGACCYLDPDNRCRIYEYRPHACQEFDCRNGWRVQGVFRKGKRAGDSDPDGRKKRFLEGLRDELIFVWHPLLKLHGLRYLPERKQVIFVLEMAGQCGPFKTQDEFDNPKLDSDAWRAVIELFASKDPLGEVRRRTRDGLELDLSDDEFAEVLWLLHKHHIVMDSRHFSGAMREMEMPEGG